MSFDTFIIKDNDIKASGEDIWGNFEFTGKIDHTKGKVKMVKQYIGQHSVDYNGTFEDNVIAGDWFIDEGCTDSFKIWLPQQPLERWKGFTNGPITKLEAVVYISDDKSEIFGIGAGGGKKCSYFYGNLKEQEEGEEGSKLEFNGTYVSKISTSADDVHGTLNTEKGEFFMNIDAYDHEITLMRLEEVKVLEEEPKDDYEDED